MSADKTPGKVAWEAYRSALIRTPADFRGLGEAYISPAWEAAAQAVREQVGGMDDRGAEAISRLGALQRRLARWRARAQDWNYDYAVALSALIDIVRPFCPDEPKPESAEACAETAGAERSKSPPPAER